MASRQLFSRETLIGGRPAVNSQERQRSRSPRALAKSLSNQALAIEAIAADLETALDQDGVANRDEVVAHHLRRLTAKFLGPSPSSACCCSLAGATAIRGAASGAEAAARPE